MLAEVGGLIGELSAMEGAGVSSVPVPYILGRLKGTLVEGAAPVARGVWYGDEYDGYADGCPVYDTFLCSRCGYVVADDGRTLPGYCPNCGAKMDTVSESDTGEG